MMTRAGLLRLAAVASVCTVAPADAKDRQPTPDEASIANAFDTAVREDGSLAGLAKLPWAQGAAVWKPEMLGELKYCRPATAGIYHNRLYLNWNQAIDPTDAAHPCGDFFAILELKKGRIKRVTFGVADIVIT